MTLSIIAKECPLLLFMILKAGLHFLNKEGAIKDLNIGNIEGDNNFTKLMKDLYQEVVEGIEIEKAKYAANKQN